MTNQPEQASQLVKCESLLEGDDHAGQGFCGRFYDPDTEWSVCPHNLKAGPDSVKPDPPLAWPYAYRYSNAHLEIVQITSVPRNLEEALDYFTNVRDSHIKKQWPVYIERKPNGTPESEYVLLPFQYNPETDEWDD